MQGQADPAAPPDDLDTLGGLDEIEETEIDAGAEDEGGEGDSSEAGGGSPAADEDAGRQAPQEVRRGRAERTRAEARELRERLDRQQAELDALRAGQQQPRVDPALAARMQQEEAERVSLLPIDQQIAYWRNQDHRQYTAYAANLEVRIADQIDRTTWQAQAQVDPFRSRYTERVDREIAQARASGRNPDRQTVYELLVGRDVLAQRASRTGQQRNGAARRVAAQQTQPVGGRGDGVRERVSGDADERLLRSINVGDI